VGTVAITRFLRPVIYQSVSDLLLPAALRDANPLELPRRLDGREVLPGSAADQTATDQTASDVDHPTN
jgi:NADP-dependent aldehyde dehydrogenase